MKKFADAFNGLKIAFRHKAVMIQLVLGIMAIIGGMILQVDDRIIDASVRRQLQIMKDRLLQPATV